MSALRIECSTDAHEAVLPKTDYRQPASWAADPPLPTPLSRMFRSSQFPAWVCPIRSSLLLRESCLFGSSEHTSSGQQGGRHVKDRRYEQASGSKDGSLSPAKTVHYTAQLSSISSDKDKHHLRDFPAENRLSKVNLSSPHQCLQVFTKTKQVWDCLINRTFYQQWRRPWGFSQSLLSRINKTQCNFLQIHQHHRWLSANPFSLTTCTMWISGRFPWKSEPFSPSIHQSRAAHRAAPRVADTWRDCLSPENESRCRQSLESNWKLYEMNKVRKGASQVQGKNQGKWASILVSLCSVEGDPAFLFTLRSSTLKGRHKGDVSFAGGKSDPADRDVVATALREAREELGINVATSSVWGVMKPLRDMSGMMIAPVLVNLGPLEELTFKPNPEEVEEIFTLAFSHLCNPQNRGYTHFRTGDKYGYTLPVFRNGKHRVWGLTAVALDHTLKLVVPPQ